MDLYTLDPAGNPIRCADWITWATSDFRIARTEVGPGYVSTIFLGWPSPRPCSGPPLLFETMTVGIDALEGEAERYPTRALALAGHARAVTAARRAVAADDGPEAA